MPEALCFDPGSQRGDPSIRLTADQVTALQALVSGAGKSARTNAAWRLGGLTVATVGTSDVTRGIKLEAEAPFSRVRLRMYSEGGAATVFRFAVGATETMATDTANNLSQVVVGGTAYNALRASAGAPGWVLGTVGGLSTFDWPGVASADNPKELVTDWVDVRSVPRADGGTRPALAIRIEHAYSTGGDYGGHSVSTWVSGASAYPWYRGYVTYAITGGGVTDLTLSTTSVSTVTTWFAVEFDYDTPAATVLGIGDSHIETHGGFAPGIHGSWLFQAVARASSAAKPIAFVNAGRAGGGVSIYTANGLTEIARLAPRIVVYQPITSNDGAPTAASVRTAQSRIAQVREACRVAGSDLVLITGIPMTSAQTPDAPTDALRLSLTTHCAGLAAAGLVTHVDFEDLLGTGASPNRIRAELQADSVHFNQTAGDQLALRMTPVLQLQAA